MSFDNSEWDALPDSSWAPAVKGNGGTTTAENGNLVSDFAAIAVTDPTDGFAGAESFDGPGSGPGYGAEVGDDACRVCKQVGHFARDCPQGGGCFNCGEQGHNKSECTKPRAFKGTCRICEKQGHPAADCPDRPPEVCRNCKQEGHVAKDCENARYIDWTGVADMKPDDAWKELEKADKARDLDDMREAIKVYTRSVPTTTWNELEYCFRNHSLNTHLIGLKKFAIQDNYTLVDMQGNIDREFKVGFYLSAKPQRSRMKDQWPSDAKENIERLKNAGLPVERGIPKCLRCNEMGHSTKQCEQERVERTDAIIVKCVNCDQAGHRVRDCPEPRKGGMTCRKCGSPEHKASDCTKTPSADSVECNYCHEVGHFAKDCPTKPKQGCRNCGEEGHRAAECVNPRNPALVQCRNCDEMGHMSKECPKPRDYSRVTCQNCGEKGHTKVRCKQPPKEEGSARVTGGFDSGFNSGFGEVAGGFDTGFDAPASDWDGPAAEQVHQDISGDVNW